MAFRFDDSFKNIMLNDIKTGAIPFLVGGPGIGKSSFTECISEIDLRTKCFTLAANQLADKADVTGARLVPTDDGEYSQVFYPHQIIQEAIRYANENPNENPILFIDEINRTTQDVTSELLSIPTLRAIGSKKLPDNLRVVCAGNDKGNVNSLDKASITRFVVYRVEPDVDTFFAVNPTLNIHIKSVLQKNPALLVCETMPKVVTAKSDDDSDTITTMVEELFDDEGAIEQSTNPRTITKCSNWMNEFDDATLHSMLGTPMASETGDASTLLQEALIAHVGNTEFMLALMLEISSQINTVSNQTNVTFVPPAVYKDLLAAPSRSDINTIVTGLSSKDVAGCLIAALSDKSADTSAIIQSIAPTITSLDQADMTALIDLAKLSKLSNGNVTAFRETQTPLSSALSGIFDTFCC